MSQEYNTRPTLLLRLRDLDDQASWTEFIEIYEPLIQRFAISRGISPADVGDVSQEVLKSVVSALRKFEYDREKGTFKGWLFTAVRREMARVSVKARKQPATPGFVDPSLKLDAVPGTEETHRWEKDYQKQLMDWGIAKIESEFSDATWKAFQLSAIEDLAAQEVGERLGISPGSVYVAKSRVLKRLREKIHSIGSGVWEMEMISPSDSF